MNGGFVAEFTPIIKEPTMVSDPLLSSYLEKQTAFWKNYTAKLYKTFSFPSLQEYTPFLVYYFTPCNIYKQFCVCFKRKIIVTV